MNKFLNTLFYLCIAVLIISLIINMVEFQHNFNSVSSNSSKKAEIQINKSSTSPLINQNENKKNDSTDKVRNKKYVNIFINNPIPLSYKTKEEVLNIRKDYVKKSIFANPDYEPSEQVFGGIEDNKPWISMNRCVKEAHDSSQIKGNSEESRDIVNPSVLISIDYYYTYISRSKTLKESYCTYPIMPMQARFNKEDNYIEVIYMKLPFNHQEFPYQLKGVNAIDFGYKYAYVDVEKSDNIVNFTKETNISNTITELQDFIHLGGSCRVEGGCNNGSPLQENLLFLPTNNKQGTTLYFKLWKDMPSSPSQEPDISEKMIILP